MPVEVRHSPPPLHHPGDVTKRPRGILKNPSFSGSSGPGTSPPKPNPLERTISAETTQTQPLTPHFDAEDAKDITLHNTLKNAGHRRSSSAARRASASRRHSSAQGFGNEDDPNAIRLKWDEANLYLAEQDAGTRMKITEPKTPYQFGTEGGMEEEDEDVAIDPRFVNVDEVDMAKSGSKKHRESDIPGLELGEPEEDYAVSPTSPGADGEENQRIVRGSLSREGSKEKHVSVSSGSGDGMDGVEGVEKVGFPTKEEEEKHRQFEERRKKHYEMKNMKGLLGNFDEMDEDEEMIHSQPEMPTILPTRAANGIS